MKQCHDMRKILQETGNGARTIVLQNELVLDNLRRKNFELYSKLNVFSLKPKKGAPVTIIQAEDVDAYKSLTTVVEKYMVLGPNGQLLLPSSAVV